MKLWFTFFVILFVNVVVAQNIGIGTTSPDSSAALEVKSSSQGFLPPRMSTIQRNAINNPAVGLQIYNTTTDCLEIYAKGRWQNIYCPTEVTTPVDTDTIPTTLNNGLVAYYPSNGNVNDESGNGNNGVVNGATLTTDRLGKINKAYSFDGLSNNIVVNNSNSLNVNELTISCWYFAKGSQMAVIVKNNQINCQEYSYGIHHQYSWDNLGPGLYTSHGIIGNCNSTIREEHYGINNEIPTNEWVFLVYTISNSGETKIYLNGILLKSYLGYPLSTCNSNSSNLRFGGPHWAGMNMFFGSIDDIRIYNRVLNQEEITYLATH